MDTYVVRIYRREGKNPHRLVGVVEEVGVEGKKAFRTLDELWAILAVPRGRVSRSGLVRAPGGKKARRSARKNE